MKKTYGIINPGNPDCIHYERLDYQDTPQGKALIGTCRKCNRTKNYTKLRRASEAKELKEQYIKNLAAK